MSDDAPRQAQPQKITYVEECAGKRADFIVYYRWRGKTWRDALWAPDAEEAKRKFLQAMRDLRRKVEIVRVDPVVIA